MTDNITDLHPVEPADSADTVLRLAIGEFQDVLVIGWDKDGELDARSSPLFADGGHVLWLFEKFKDKLLNGDYGP